MELQDVLLVILAIIFIVYALLQLLINGYFAKKQKFMDYTLQKAKELKHGVEKQKKKD